MGRQSPAPMRSSILETSSPPVEESSAVARTVLDAPIGTTLGESVRDVTIGPAISAIGVNSAQISPLSQSAFVTHALWYHQRATIASIARVPDDVIFGQVRDFFLHAMRHDDPAASND